MEQLTQEGLKLSKQELNQSNIIKKLRVKEKEVESNVTTLKSDLEKSRKDIQELNAVLSGKNEAEKHNLGMTNFVHGILNTLNVKYDIYFFRNI